MGCFSKHFNANGEMRAILPEHHFCIKAKERVLVIKSINDVTCWATVEFTSKFLTRKYMTHGVISIDSILLNSMRNGKNVNFRGRKIGITSPPP